MSTDQLRHESPELGDMTFRMFRALARRAGDGDTEALEQLTRLEHLLTEQTAAAAAGLHVAGYSWTTIGALTGTSRQNAQQRWGTATVMAAHPQACRCDRPMCPRVTGVQS